MERNTWKKDPCVWSNSNKALANNFDMSASKPTSPRDQPSGGFHIQDTQQVVHSSSHPIAGTSDVSDQEDDDDWTMDSDQESLASEDSIPPLDSNRVKNPYVRRADNQNHDFQGGNQPETHVPGYSPPPDHKLALDQMTGFWEQYDKFAKECDEGRIGGLNDDLNSLLTFAGLFSAINTSSIIESMKELKEDAAEITNDLLKTSPTPPNVPSPTTFEDSPKTPDPPRAASEISTREPDEEDALSEDPQMAINADPLSQSDGIDQALTKLECEDCQRYREQLLQKEIQIRALLEHNDLPSQKLRKGSRLLPQLFSSKNKTNTTAFTGSGIYESRPEYRGKTVYLPSEDLNTTTPGCCVIQ